MPIYRRFCTLIFLVFLFVTIFGPLYRTVTETIWLLEDVLSSTSRRGLNPRLNLISTGTQIPPRDVSVSTESEMERRKKTLDQACDTIPPDAVSNSDSRKSLLIAPGKDLVLCYVPKAGCTAWKRIFLTLRNLKTSDKDPRYYMNVYKKNVHKAHFDTLHDLEFDQAFQVFKSAKKFIFARDPYARLFSGYVDKFVLPDFWGLGTEVVINKYRQNPDEISKICGHNLTFEEFLRMVLSCENKPKPSDIEAHWMPISQLCRPCSFRYDFIGKLETFTADRDFILTRAGYKDSIPFNDSLEKTAIDSMSQVSLLMWNKLKTMPIQCQNSLIKLQSLLRGFGYQGFLPSRVSIPWTNTDAVTLEELVEFLKVTYRKQNLTKEDHMRRRHSAIVAAYSTVPYDVLAGIRRMFARDFHLFDYDLFPDYVSLKNRES